MRFLVFTVLSLSALIISAVVASLLWAFGLASALEATLCAGFILQTLCLGVGAFHLMRTNKALARFAQAAQTHFVTLEETNESLSGGVESLEDRIRVLKRDLVSHLGTHESLPIDASGASSLQQLKPVPPKTASLNSTQSIASAILANRIDLFVQPTVTLPARKTVFYECLSRLRSEAGDTLYPSSYLAHVAQSKLIGTLDNFLLLRCVHIIRKLHRKTPLETFFLNISAASLGDPDFYEQLIDFLAGDKALAEHLVLELQSSDLGALLPVIAPGLSRLKASGYRFALDGAHPNDVDDEIAAQGFGYVKVAARHLTAMEDPQAFVQRAKELGITLIATHVEDEKTLIDLSEFGISHAQGFLIAKPAPWDQIDQQKRLSGAA